MPRVSLACLALCLTTESGAQGLVGWGVGRCMHVRGVMKGACCDLVRVQMVENGRGSQLLRSLPALSKHFKSDAMR